MTSHEKWIELADLYAVGALEGAEAADFDLHLQSGCQNCQARIQENESALLGLVSAMPKLQVPESLKARVMDAVEEGPATLAQPLLKPAWAVLVWFAICGIIIFSWKATSLKRHTTEFHYMENTMAQTHPFALELKTTQAAATQSVTAKVMWDQKGECIFMTMGLAKPSSDKTYQLWGILGDKKISAGIFRVDEHGCGMLVLNRFAPKDFEKMAVTLEPAGGVPSPTGPIVLLGSR